MYAAAIAVLNRSCYSSRETSLPVDDADIIRALAELIPSFITAGPVPAPAAGAPVPQPDRPAAVTDPEAATVREQDPVLDAARKQFAERAYADVTIGDITATCGI